MPHEALINGVPADASVLQERAFQFGDGLFETIAVIDGRPCLWDGHLARLAEGCRRLKLPLPDSESLLQECRRLTTTKQRAVLKMFVTAGRSPRGYRRPTTLMSDRILYVSDWPGADADQPWRVRLCKHRLSSNPVLAQIKHLNRLDQVIARAEWNDPSIAEGLMLDQRGQVVSGSMSNLYLQFGDRLITPPIEDAGIAGVVRGLAIQIGQQRGSPLSIEPCSVERVRAADALYLSNSLIGVRRIGWLEARAYAWQSAEHPVMALTRERCHRADSTEPSDG